MAVMIFDVGVGLFARVLANLRRVLEKGAAHAKAEKIEQSVLLGARLFPDMFPLRRQVTLAVEHARNAGGRLAGQEQQMVDDSARSFEDLIDLIDQTLEYLRELPAIQLEGSETREIVRPVRGVPHKFNGMNYLLQFALPNFFFHTTTAYAILRHNGVVIGKADFLGSLD